MVSYNYVIVGGGVAAGKACEGIRELDQSGSIAVVTDEPHRPYHRPSLSKEYLIGEKQLEEVFVGDEDFYTENDIDLITNTRALKIDPAGHSVTLNDDRTLEYRRLLLATGGRARRLPLPGADLENVFTLRTIENSQAIQEAGGEGRRALVMGGSFIGSEVAASLTMRGTDVTMLFPGSRLLERLAPQELSDFLHQMYKEKGIRILTGTVATALRGDGAVKSVELDNDEALEIDMSVMGVGIRLNTELAGRAGLELGMQNAVIVDERLRTSDPSIYAAGDIAAWPDRTFNKRLRVEHWDVARGHGLQAGRNMAGEDKAYTRIPYFFSDLFDFSFEVWGNLTSWDQTVLRGSLEEGSFAFYYFDQGQMTGVLTTGRPDEEREPMQELVRARPSYESVVTGLRDESMDLVDLLE